MQFEIIPTERFEDDIRYYLKKKKVFDDNETIKVRIANTDTKVGKSNGYRMIYYVVKNDYEIYLLTIYYKKEDNRIPSNKEIEELVKEYCL